jgi:hypothetical protein
MRYKRVTLHYLFSFDTAFQKSDHELEINIDIDPFAYEPIQKGIKSKYDLFPLGNNLGVI